MIRQFPMTELPPIHLFSEQHGIAHTTLLALSAKLLTSALWFRSLGARDSPGGGVLLRRDFSFADGPNEGLPYVNVSGSNSSPTVK